MAQNACEIMCIGSFKVELSFPHKELMIVKCNNQAVIYIANKLIFHDRTKLKALDCHFIRDAIFTLSPPHRESISNIFTKKLGENIFSIKSDKLGMLDTYTLT